MSQGAKKANTTAEEKFVPQEVDINNLVAGRDYYIKLNDYTLTNLRQNLDPNISGIAIGTFVGLLNQGDVIYGKGLAPHAIHRTLIGVGSTQDAGYYETLAYTDSGTWAEFNNLRRVDNNQYQNSAPIMEATRLGRRTPQQGGDIIAPFFSRTDQRIQGPSVPERPDVIGFSFHEINKDAIVAEIVGKNFGLGIGRYMKSFVKKGGKRKQKRKRRKTRKKRKTRRKIRKRRRKTRRKKRK